MTASLWLRIARWFALCALLAGCQAPPPPPPSIDDLHFPVVVLFGDAAVGSYRDATALGTMLISNLNAATGPPPLIDSQFTIYRLNKLASTHHSLWFLFHSTGSTAVTFELERAPQSGRETARALLRHRLDTLTWRSDLERDRRDLVAAQTLAEMLAIVQGEESRREEVRP